MRPRRRTVRSVSILVAGLLLPSCTLRLGAPGPMAFTAAAFLPAHDDTPDLARWIRGSGAGIMVVLADRPAEWFGVVLGDQENRVLPERRGGWQGGIAAPGLSRREGRSDLPPLRAPPALAAPLLVEGRFRVGRRPVHLLGARIPSGGGDPLRSAVRALLERIAEESGADALVLVAVALEDPADGPELDLLVGEYLLGTDRCADPLPPPPGLRFYRAPVALSECSFARALEGGGILLGLSTSG